MREHILAEIKRLATENGAAPCKTTFARQAGIREHQWSGIFWARCPRSCRIRENTLQGRFKTEDVLLQIVAVCRHYGRVPSAAEMKLYRIEHPSFPSHNKITNHFATRSLLIKAPAQLSTQSEEFHDIALMVRELTSHDEEPAPLSSSIKKVEGSVYLLKSGGHYKIGRSDELERRVKEIRLALPEAVTLIHTIRTDDPAGIEAYWHRRFADRRANGEWFKLGADDLTAFKKRKYQ